MAAFATYGHSRRTLAGNGALITRQRHTCGSAALIVWPRHTCGSRTYRVASCQPDTLSFYLRLSKQTI